MPTKSSLDFTANPYNLSKGTSSLDQNQKAWDDRGDWLMSADILREIIEKVDLLSTEEQLDLIATLEEKVRASTAVGTQQRRKWSDLIGMLSYPACGEDAQTYISRSRREADEKRLADTDRYVK